VEEGYQSAAAVPLNAQLPRGSSPLFTDADGGAVDTFFPRTNRTGGHPIALVPHRDGKSLEHWASRDDLGIATQLDRAVVAGESDRRGDGDLVVKGALMEALTLKDEVASSEVCLIDISAFPVTRPRGSRPLSGR